ncbi:hypothetical protein Cgig2_018139 [Carnegiea gigantea]|uniref:Uncharacterized protein n=1 Tax=Carnegiea gigantea TaxID=171969 RepID=A0A9Q1KX52_9CARY|nr:hypothetical protein Cgig2_018139 [Carnegiea gigantea]
MPDELRREDQIRSRGAEELRNIVDEDSIRVESFIDEDSIRVESFILEIRRLSQLLKCYQDCSAPQSSTIINEVEQNQHPDYMNVEMCTELIETVERQAFRSLFPSEDEFLYYTDSQNLIIFRFVDGTDIDRRSLDDFKQLERQLDAALVQIRTRKIPCATFTNQFSKAAHDKITQKSRDVQVLQTILLLMANMTSQIAAHYQTQLLQESMMALQEQSTTEFSDSGPAARPDLPPLPAPSTVTPPSTPACREPDNFITSCLGMPERMLREENEQLKEEVATLKGEDTTGTHINPELNSLEDAHMERPRPQETLPLLL